MPAGVAQGEMNASTVSFLSRLMWTCRVNPQTIASTVVPTTSRTSGAFGLSFCGWLLLCNSKHTLFRGSLSSFTHWVKQKNRSKAPVSLPQTAILVIRLPNLGSNGKTARASRASTTSQRLPIRGFSTNMFSAKRRNAR